MAKRTIKRAARARSSNSTKHTDKPAATLDERVHKLREQLWDIQGIIVATAEGLHTEKSPGADLRRALRLAWRLLDQLGWDLLEISEPSEVQS